MKNSSTVNGVSKKRLKASCVQDLKNTPLSGYISERTCRFARKFLNIQSIYDLLNTDPNKIELKEWFEFGNGNLNANTPRTNELRRFVRSKRRRIKFILQSSIPSPETHSEA